MKLELFDTYWINGAFLCYLVNGDGTGLAEGEAQTLDHWAEEFNSPVYEVAEGAEASFTVCDVCGLGADCYEVKVFTLSPETKAEEVAEYGQHTGDADQKTAPVQCYAHPVWMLTPKKDKPDTLEWESIGEKPEPLNLKGCEVVRSDEDEDEDDQAADFAAIVADLGLTIDAARISTRPDKVMDDFKGDHWRIELEARALGTGLELYYSKGYGHGGAEPDLKEVIHCLLMDSDVVEYGNFEEWAECMGYDTDSRQALKIYEACEEQADKFNAFLMHNGHTFEALRESLEDY